MAKVYKIAGQSTPEGTVDTIIYTVPSGKEFVASNMSITNRSTNLSASFRIALVPQGESLGNKHYIEYDAFIDCRESKRVPINLGMDEGTKVYIRTNLSNLSFTLGGVEIDK